jgi:pseudouridine-5'-phosphate glycosidase
MMVPRPPACQGCTQECTLFLSLVAGGKATHFACCQGCPSVQQPAGGGGLPSWALGVPLVGLGTPYFPRFLSEGNAQLRVNTEAADPGDAARLFSAHRELLPDRGMLLCVPPLTRFALPAEVMERAIEDGLAECERVGARGPEVTPVLLSAVARASRGASLATNLAVLIHNARIGARVATQLAHLA